MAEGRIVYSTRHGRTCPTCARPIAECVCGKPSTRRPGDGIARVRREVKGRGGKTVTTITGLPLEAAVLEALGSDLRRMCGAGGSVKDGIIVIQGDRVAVVLEELRKRGYTAKQAGG